MNSLLTLGHRRNGRLAKWNTTRHYVRMRGMHPGIGSKPAGILAVMARAIVCSLLLALSPGPSAQQAESGDKRNHDDFDLDALVDRVSHAKSLGFLTKISLKQDVDRLLESIRKAHEGTAKASLDQAREKYDVLVHKLIALLQDKEGELAKSVEDGREKLWAILSDEKKFASI